MFLQKQQILAVLVINTAPQAQTDMAQVLAVLLSVSLYSLCADRAVQEVHPHSE